MDTSNLGDIIRWPFELFGKIINFVFSYFLEIGIIVASLYILYFIFSRGIIGRIVDWWIHLNDKEVEIVEINNLKGGIEKNV